MSGDPTYRLAIWQWRTGVTKCREVCYLLSEIGQKWDRGQKHSDVLTVWLLQGWLFPARQSDRNISIWSRRGISGSRAGLLDDRLKARQTAITAEPHWQRCIIEVCCWSSDWVTLRSAVARSSFRWLMLCTVFSVWQYYNITVLSGIQLQCWNSSNPAESRNPAKKFAGAGFGVICQKWPDAGRGLELTRVPFAAPACWIRHCHVSTKNGGFNHFRSYYITIKSLKCSS